AASILYAFASPAAIAANLDPKLVDALSTAGASDVFSVVVTYKAQPTAADIQSLRNMGIKYGVTFQSFPMAGVWANKAQINQINSQAGVRSIWMNSKLRYYNKEATALIGAVKQRTMTGFGFSG